VVLLLKWKVLIKVAILNKIGAISFNVLRTKL